MAEMTKSLKILFFLLIIFLMKSCKDHSDKLFEFKNDTGIQFNNKLTPTPSLNISNIVSEIYLFSVSGYLK